MKKDNNIINNIKLFFENFFINVSKCFKKAINYSKTNILFFSFVLTSVINSTMLRMFTVKNGLSISPILADTAVVIFIGSICYFLKPKHQFKYLFTVSIIFTLLCIINSVYYTNYVSFSSVSLLKAAGQLGGVKDSVTNLLQARDFYYLFQIVALLFVHEFLKRKGYYKRVEKIEVGKVRFLNTVVSGLIILGFFISTLTGTDISRLSKQWNPEYIVMKYGIYTYHINDLVTNIKSSLNPLFGYDKAAAEFREFYSEEREDKTNEYTNILQGKNIIAIHAESVQNWVINTTINGKEITPNLNKLAKEGLYFSNFYAQESTGTSSDSEFTYASSLLPASKGTVFVNYYDRKYVTLQNMLKEKGYYTFSMHGNNCSFWNRKLAYESIGYDRFYCYTNDYTIDDTVGLGLSDKSFFRQSVEILKGIKQDNKNYYGTMIMLSNHTPFNNNGEPFSDFDVKYHFQKLNEETGEYEDATWDYLSGKKLGYYIQSVHYADEALGELIQYLEDNNLMEDTILVLYGDHDAKVKKSDYNFYYNFNPETGEMYDKDDERYDEVDYYDYELNRKVPLIMWTSDSKLKNKFKGEVTKVMGMYDVQPTLANMLGVKSKYALGHDIFSIDENVVVFPDGNWLTDKMYYNRSKDQGKMLDINETVGSDYINYYNDYSDKLITVSNSIITYDLILKTEEQEKILNEVIP